MSQKANANEKRETVILCGSNYCPPVPTVLLVEPRDEVFARLAADLSDAGFMVLRAVDEATGCRRCLHQSPEMVIVNADLLEWGGKMLARVVQRAARRASLWFYKSRKNAVDVSSANALCVDELIDYRGDLLTLADAIADCLAGNSPKSLIEPVADRPGACSTERARAAA